MLRVIYCIRDTDLTRNYRERFNVDAHLRVTPAIHSHQYISSVSTTYKYCKYTSLRAHIRVNIDDI